MHTLSFYSYKGGVGRSLAVKYTAEQLARRGKKVLVADFDFEAPGLPYKFAIKQEEIKLGMVDYVHHFVSNKQLPDSLSPYLFRVEFRGNPRGEVWMLPAGATLERSYWQRMAEIDWHHLVYGQKGIGVLFFWEWKLRVEQELQPDVLLIDARTGVTDLSTITLQLLADQVIVLGANNDENLDGCRLILESLQRAPKFEFKENPRAHFLLTRLPAPSPEFSEAAERRIVNEALQRLNNQRPAINPLISQMLVIHSDDRLMIDEKLLWTEPRIKIWRIEREYLRLLELVFRDTPILSFEEKEELRRQTDSYYCLEQAERANNKKQKLEFLGKALEIDENSIPALIEKATLSKEPKDLEKLDRLMRLAVETDSADEREINGFSWLMKDIDSFRNSAIWVFDQCILRNPWVGGYYYNRGVLYSHLKEYELALADFDTALVLDGDRSEGYHARACVLFYLGNYRLALESIQISLELDSSKSNSYSALAEIQSALGNEEEFYDALEKMLALDSSEFENLDPQTLARHEGEERFQEMIKKYKLS